MTRFIAIFIAALAFMPVASADDRPVDFKNLPKAAQEFVHMNFPDDNVLAASVDDDLIRPDYKVVLASGTRIEFEHSGALDKVSVRNGNVPEGIMPEQICKYVSTHYQGLRIVEYEVGRHNYEVKLSDGLELKFNSSFILIEVDD